MSGQLPLTPTPDGNCCRAFSDSETHSAVQVTIKRAAWHTRVPRAVALCRETVSHIPHSEVVSPFCINAFAFKHRAVSSTQRWHVRYAHWCPPYGRKTAASSRATIDGLQFSGLGCLSTDLAICLLPTVHPCPKRPAQASAL